MRPTNDSPPDGAPAPVAGTFPAPNLDEMEASRAAEYTELTDVDIKALHHDLLRHPEPQADTQDALFSPGTAAAPSDDALLQQHRHRSQLLGVLPSVWWEIERTHTPEQRERFLQLEAEVSTPGAASSAERISQENLVVTNLHSPYSFTQVLCIYMHGSH